MKIVYFIDHLRPDGAQHVLKELVAGFAARGYEQCVICLNDSWDETFKQKVVESGAQVRVVGKVPLAAGYGWLSVWRFLRREKFDVAWTCLFVADLVGRTLARLAHIPRIVTSLQTHNVNYARWQRALVRFTMRWADVVVLSSEQFREFAIRGEGASPERTVFIPNSVRVAQYGLSLSRAALRAQLNVPPDCVLLGSAGRLVYQKGFDVLLNALALLPRQDVLLLIAGVGSDQEKLQAQALTLGLQDRVRFLGQRRDIPHLLHCFDLYVHASRFEGMPIIVLEAMASGCPIVATAVDGTRELIQDGVHGWLVPPEDPERLANAIQCALANPADAQRRAEAAFERVRSEFDTECILSKWDQVLRNRSN